MSYLQSIIDKLILRHKTTPWTANSQEADFLDAGEPVSTLDEANIITSVLKDPIPSPIKDTAPVCANAFLVPETLHIPLFDLDMPCSLVESSTPGHFHLMIDKPIPFGKYMNILYAMMEAGIIEQGYYDSTGVRGYGALRKPGVTKEGTVATP